MPQSDPYITLALSQFFQNDDPGLAWVHARKAAPSEPQPAPAPSAVVAPEASAETASA
jgi:hypothetical protein